MATRSRVRAHTRQTAHGATRVRAHTRQTTGAIVLEAWNSYRRTRHFDRRTKRVNRFRTAGRATRRAGNYMKQKRYGKAAMYATWGAATFGGWALGRGFGAAGMFALGATVAVIVATDKQGPVRRNPHPSPKRKSSVYDED